MTWATFYLICFVVGLVFSLLSVVGSIGRFHLPARWHIPHFLGHHAGPAHVPPLHVHGAGHAARLPAMHRSAGGARGSEISFFNFSSLMAFLAWFGGTGYLLTRYTNLLAAAAFGLAMATGLAAASVVFVFLARVLLAHETCLDPADFERVGMLGKVTVTIRAGGTGEIIFSQGGTRQVTGARSEDGSSVPKGTEVVITRCEKGIAYVRRWEDMARESDESAGAKASGSGA